MSYFRPGIDATQGYTPGEQPQTVGILKLNTNENPYPPSPRVYEAIQKAATERLRLYPDPLATRFREVAGELYGVSPDWIVAANGSDDALTMLTRACLDTQDLMVVPTPSYPLYRVLAQLQGCGYAERPFTEDWQLSKDFTAGAKLVFIPNPNSPTGTVIAAEQLSRVAEAATCLVVVDEAYVDFADDNCIRLVRACERLVVTRTFSKSYSLAGIRFGFAVAQPKVIAALRKVKDSYNCDALSIVAATAALEDQIYFLATVAKIKATRQRLARELARLGFSTLDSHANFVWAQRPTPVKPLYETLRERGILIRYLRYDHCEGLRISVGTDAEIDRLLDTLTKLV